jgi:hypothetical protein
MKGKTTALFVTAILVLVSAVAVAHHVETPPPVSRGGELAYVRDYPPVGQFPEPGEWLMDATYVSFSLLEAEDSVSGYTSKGRFGDNEVFSTIQLPPMVLGGDRTFHAVQNHNRGLLEASDGAGRFLVLNGVNAGMAVQAKTDGFAVTFNVTEGLEIAGGGDHLRIRNDGHTYNLAIVNCDDAQFDVDGTLVSASLGSGCEVRGWLSGFPATTQVMDWEFDHIRHHG